MISSDKITEIYFIVDEFYKEFEKALDGHIIDKETGLKRRKKRQKFSDSEVICIMILFHLSYF